jgi:hypothetical protein
LSLFGVTDKEGGGAAVHGGLFDVNHGLCSSALLCDLRDVTPHEVPLLSCPRHMGVEVMRMIAGVHVESDPDSRLRASSRRAEFTAASNR